jgi:hypothetical protein
VVSALPRTSASPGRGEKESILFPDTVLRHREVGGDEAVAAVAGSYY